MPNEEDPRATRQFSAAGLWDQNPGLEIKARGTETAKKAEKEKNTESNWNKFATIA